MGRKENYQLTREMVIMIRKLFCIGFLSFLGLQADEQQWPLEIEKLKENLKIKLKDKNLDLSNDLVVQITRESDVCFSHQVRYGKLLYEQNDSALLVIGVQRHKKIKK